MTRQAIVLPQAQLDIEEAALWYETEQEGLGARFLRGLDHLLERIVASPQQFPKIDETVRRGLMRRFPFGAYFVCTETEVHVLAVLHLSRRPGQWKQRTRRGGQQQSGPS